MISEISKNNKPLVSVVVPVYNTDLELLHSCYLSLIHQDYSNLEIIIVDDGSNMETNRFCDYLKGLDSRTRVLHQNNQGVSAARNNGTLAACGEFILYVDGDDLLARFAIQEGINAIRLHNVDLVIAGIIKVYSHQDFRLTEMNGVSKYEMVERSNFDILRKHYISLDNSSYIKINGQGYINRGPYCRLIKRSVALSNPFPKGLPIGEDLIWNMNLLDSCQRICVIHNIWYGYYISGSSAIRKYYGNRKELVEKYLRLLWKTNKDFCEKNITVYGKNIAVELYCLLSFELLSSNCVLTFKQKNKLVKKLLDTNPWRLLKCNKVFKQLPFKYKAMIILCRLKLWQFALKINNKVK